MRASSTPASKMSSGQGAPVTPPQNKDEQTNPDIPPFDLCPSTPNADQSRSSMCDPSECLSPYCDGSEVVDYDVSFPKGFINASGGSANKNSATDVPQDSNHNFYFEESPKEELRIPSSCEKRGRFLIWPVSDANH